jgi:hypothetical protein
VAEAQIAASVIKMNVRTGVSRVLAPDSALARN